MGDISIRGKSPILRQGFAKGGRAGFKHGTKPDWKKGKFGKKTIAAMKKHDFPAGGPHQSLKGKKAALQHSSTRAHEHKHGKDSKAKGGRAGFSMAGKVVRDAKKVFKRITHEVPTGPHTDVRRRELNKKFRRKEAAKGGRIGLKKGGSDKNWMQKVNKSIKKRGTKGKCTPITKPGCTGRAKALAKTFKKIAAKNKKA